MPSLFILNAPEFKTIIEVASADPLLTRRDAGPYAELFSHDAIVIDRRASGARHAIWYSAIAGVSDGKIVQHDKDQLKIVPIGAEGRSS